MIVYQGDSDVSYLEVEEFAKRVKMNQVSEDQSQTHHLTVTN